MRERHHLCNGPSSGQWGRDLQLPVRRGAEVGEAIELVEGVGDDLVVGHLLAMSFGWAYWLWRRAEDTCSRARS